MNPALNRERQRAAPSTYLITFVCYGTWLHGEPGAVDRDHNLPGGPFVEEDLIGVAAVKARMKQEAYVLDAVRREAVLTGLKAACDRRNWALLAAHVRSTHVHSVVQAEQTPEQVINALKCYASRELNRTGLDSPNRRRWARHGSTRYLWKRDEVSAAIHYVVCDQGEPMAVFEEGG